MTKTLGKITNFKKVIFNMKQVRSSNKKLIVLASWSKINIELLIFRPLILILRTELRGLAVLVEAF